METSALVVLERAERAARERRLAAGLDAERLVEAARREADRIDAEAASEAATAAAAAAQAIAAAADREVAALQARTTRSVQPSPAALAAASGVVVAAVLGEIDVEDLANPRPAAEPAEPSPREG
jgi:vacuolar-type H+-ATPase subunit H